MRRRPAQPVEEPDYTRPEKVDPTTAPISIRVPDPVEWEESLIGIEPNSGVVDPPPIC